MHAYLVIANSLMIRISTKFEHRQLIMLKPFFIDNNDFNNT